jgi:hypothetical protein
MVSNTVHFLDGETSKFVQVPIINDALVEVTESIPLLLTNAVGKAVLGVDESILNIVDDDFAPGEFSLEFPSFRVYENAGFATVTIVRTNGYTGLVELDYSTSDLTAKTGQDYTGVSGKVVFGDSELSRSFDIPIIDDELNEDAEAFRVRLLNPSAGAFVLPPSFATVIIEDDESSSEVDSIMMDGANGTVYSVALDDSDNAIFGGEFSGVNGRVLSRLARMLPNGTIDKKFDVGLGPNNTVFKVAVSNSGGVWLGGLFNQVNGENRGHLALLKADGSIDEDFDPGAALEGTVFDILEIQDGLLVGGDFGLVKLNYDGSLNEAFQSPELNGAVHSLDATPGRGVVIGGSFTSVNGVDRVRIAKLNPNGLLDVRFGVGEGPNGDVYAVNSLRNGGVLAGGLFVTVDGLSARRFALLQSDGSLDRSLNVGAGFSGPVRVIEVRADGL